MELNILHGSEPIYPYPKESVGQHILKSLLKGGSNIGMVDAVTGQQITYSDIRTKTLTLAAHLNDIGLCESDVITICGENSLDFFIPAIAAFYLGIIVAPINHSYVPREMIHAMNISKPKMIFCSIKVVDNILIASKEIPSIQKIVVFGEHAELPNDIQSLDDFLKRKLLVNNFEVVDLKPDHSATIMCSSGTTGLAKGVVLTHANLLVCVSHLGNSGYGGLTPDKTAMALLPFFHAYGFCMHFSQIALNMKIVILPYFEEKLFFGSIEKYKITNLYLVPPLVIFLAKSPAVDRYNLTSLNQITCGAAPLCKEVQDIVKKRLKICDIRQGYGMTETTLAVLMQPPNVDRSGTSGLLVPSMSCKVLNIDTGKAVGSYCEGELCFKGPLIMKQYCGDLQATAGTIDENGWLHTGDLGYYDKDGYFYIVDRLKELIKFKGFQVPPAELEAILITHPQIKDAAVIGVPDEMRGELATAYIVKQPNATITEQEIMDFVKNNVSYHKRLHGGVKYINEIPKNASGKILRRVLRDALTNNSKL